MAVHPNGGVGGVAVANAAPPRFAAVTTCNADGWKLYGRRMVESWRCYWPTEVPLTIYAEGFRFAGDDRTFCHDLDAAAPWLAPWKAKCPPQFNGKHFKHDAARFVHKVAALGVAAEATDVEVLIWLDADTVTHAPVTTDWLDSLFPSDADLALLLRPPHYPETGCIMARSRRGTNFLVNVMWAYQIGVIFDWEQQHDAYVIGRMAERAARDGSIRLHSLSGPQSRPGHPWLGSRLAERTDHCKGNRKLKGRSPSHERHIRDGNPYWQ